jgi:hypothetical protein
MPSNVRYYATDPTCGDPTYTDRLARGRRLINKNHKHQNVYSLRCTFIVNCTYTSRGLAVSVTKTREFVADRMQMVC